MALFSRPLTEQESSRVEHGLRSSDGVWARHCQILWASSKGKTAQAIAETLGWHTESVRRILRLFNREGLEALRSRKPPGPKGLEKKISPDALTGLLTLLRQSPQTHGLSEPIWTASALATLAYQKGLLSERVRGERLRRMLARQGITWKQAKGWLKSPDAHYAKKKRDGMP